MKSLENEYEVHRFDIKTGEKKIFKKYSEIIRTHKQLDVRFDEDTSDKLLTIKDYSIQKIFSLINEYPEEFILFLFLSENKNNTINPSTTDTSIIVNQQNSLDRLVSYDSDISQPKEENSEEYRIAEYYCIFSVLYFIMAGLISIHFLQFLFSKQVRIENIFIF